MRKPASVSYGPLRAAGTRSPRPARPRAARPPPARCGRPLPARSHARARSAAGSRSYSSAISPTSSSTRSSMVTTPSVPPYSSTTTARSRRRPPAACASTPSRSRLSGTNTGSRAMPATVVVVPVRRRVRRGPSITSTTPVTWSTVVVVDREPAVPGRRDARDQQVGDAGTGRQRDHVHPRRHRLGRPLLAEPDRALQQHRGVLRQRAGPGRDRGQQPQLLRRAGAGQLLLRLHAEPADHEVRRCR